MRLGLPVPIRSRLSSQSRLTSRAIRPAEASGPSSRRAIDHRLSPARTRVAAGPLTSPSGGDPGCETAAVVGGEATATGVVVGAEQARPQPLRPGPGCRAAVSGSCQVGAGALAHGSSGSARAPCAPSMLGAARAPPVPAPARPPVALREAGAGVAGTDGVAGRCRHRLRRGRRGRPGRARRRAPAGASGSVGRLGLHRRADPLVLIAARLGAAGERGGVVVERRRRPRDRSRARGRAARRRAASPPGVWPASGAWASAGGAPAEKASKPAASAAWPRRDTSESTARLPGEPLGPAAWAVGVERQPSMLGRAGGEMCTQRHRAPSSRCGHLSRACGSFLLS